MRAALLALALFSALATAQDPEPRNTVDNGEVIVNEDVDLPDGIAVRITVTDGQPTVIDVAYVPDTGLPVWLMAIIAQKRAESDAVR